MILSRVLLLTVLFASKVDTRHHHHRQKSPHFRSVIPGILNDVEDMDELKGSIEQQLQYEKEEPEKTIDRPLQDIENEVTTTFDIDKPLEEHEIPTSLRPIEVIRKMSTTFGHKFLECEAMYRYPTSIKLLFLNYWNGEQIMDRMAGCALLCIGQKLDMMDESGKMKVAENIEFLKANEADEEMIQTVMLLVVQCRRIVDGQKLNDDVCGAALLFSVCFRDGIKALGWAPQTVARKYLQVPRNGLLNHLDTSNRNETLLNDTRSKNIINSYNDIHRKKIIKESRIADEHYNATTQNVYEYTTAQTLTDFFENKIKYAKNMIKDMTSAFLYDTNNSVNIYKNMSELTASEAIEDAKLKINSMEAT